MNNIEERLTKVQTGRVFEIDKMYGALWWHNSNPEAGDYSEEYQAVYHESLPTCP